MCMPNFPDQVSSTIALVRALFGDFSFEEISDNSRGYLNQILFLTYLFTAVFILLSMFLSILGESQAVARTNENEEKERGEHVDYGTFQVCAWRVRGMCMACAWRVYGVCVARAWRVHGVCMAACLTSQDIYDWLRKKHKVRTTRLKAVKDRKRGKPVAAEVEEEEEEEEEDEVESEEANQLRRGLEKMHEQLERQAKKSTASLELRVVKELRKLTAKHEARQAKRAEQLGARPAACKTPSGAARRDGGYDGGYGKSCKSGGAGGGTGGGAGGGDKGKPIKPVARGSVHAAADKGKALDRVAERAKAGGGGKGSVPLRQGSRSAERRAKSPVPGEQVSPERAMSTDSPARKACEGSPLKVRRESSPIKDRAGGASGGADGGRGGASRSHPGKSYEREWSKVRGAAKATSPPVKRHSSAPVANVAREPSPAGQRRHSSVDAVDEEFAC